jgi:hypothetical protein
MVGIERAIRGAGSRAVVGGTLAGLLFLLGPASAWGTTRYAAPGGVAPDTVCVSPQAAPCSIHEAAAGPDVADGDEAVISPGSYSDTAGDLGADGSVDIMREVNVHGSSGQPRPLITLNSNRPFGAFSVDPERARLAHVEIDSFVSTVNLTVFAGVAEDVVATNSGQAAAIACEQFDGVIRDSACTASGTGAAALGVEETEVSVGPVIRNVTALATGTFGDALLFSYGPAVMATVDAKSVIAEGAGADVAVSGGTETSTVKLEHSDYDNVVAFDLDVTPAGTGTNITAAPLLAADGIHELAGSPTIDAGAIDDSSGAADIDGQGRTIGSAPDIGADEFKPPPSPGGGPVGGGAGDGSPDGRLGKRPRKRTIRRIARFTFSSAEVGSQFRCKLDRTSFVPCSSPFSRRVKPGKHRFSVEAVDAAGNVDPSPATYRWRVLARRATDRAGSQK